jgi:hypothetical protein
VEFHGTDNEAGEHAMVTMNCDLCEARGRELQKMREFLEAYWKTYAATQKHPSVTEEAAVINMARQLRGS